jgi:hypothetical protein
MTKTTTGRLAIAGAVRVEVVLGNSRYGISEPRIEVRLVENEDTGAAQARMERAALFEVAAQVEVESRGYGWIVNVDNDRRCVALELVKATEREVKVGLSVLHAVAKKIATGGEEVAG